MENENLDLNQENLEGQQEDNKTYSKEEYEELQRKYDDVVNQNKASSKEAQKLNWIAQVAVDNTKFLKLYNSDKRQAEEVAKHFGRASAKELYEQIKNEYGDNAGGIDMEDVEQKAEAIANKKFAQQTLSNFKDKYGISGKLDKTFTAEFDGLMDGKDWTSEEVEKQAKRALKLCRDTDEFQAELGKANSRLAGAGITGSSKANNTSTGGNGIYAQWKDNEAKQSIFGQYGKKKDF